MKILVTGGAGFIGSHIVDSLVAKGHEVIVYDNMSSGDADNLKSVSKDIEFVKGDINDLKSLNKVMKGVDILSHQAAQLEIGRCLDDPIYDLMTNTGGTLNVLKSAVENNVSKIINASSACIYGQAVQQPQPETHPKNPNWAYGVSKLAAEKYCEIFSNNHGIPIISLRYGIVYGEREWFGRVLPIFVKRFIQEEPLVIFGKGDQIRDFIYVKDVAEAHNRCIDYNKTDAFNVATGKPTSVVELAEKISDNVVFEEVKEGDFSKHMKRRRTPQELKVMCLDVSKAKQKLGWEPKTDLKDGVQKEINWARENLDKWKVDDIIRV